MMVLKTIGTTYIILDTQSGSCDYLCIVRVSKSSPSLSQERVDLYSYIYIDLAKEFSSPYSRYIDRQADFNF